MLRMVADYVGDCWALRQPCWGPGICSWGMKTGGKIQWEEQSVRCASFHQPWDKRAPVCINFEKETIWPHFGWPTQRDCLLIHRSVLLEEQKSSKRGKEIWGLSPTQALSSVTVNRSCFWFNIIWVYSRWQVLTIPSFLIACLPSFLLEAPLGSNLSWVLLHTTISPFQGKGEKQGKDRKVGSSTFLHF